MMISKNDNICRTITEGRNSLPLNTNIIGFAKITKPAIIGNAI